MTSKIGIHQRANPNWPKTERGRHITVTPRPIIGPGSKVFAMGSCFAREIRVALRTIGYDVYPRYFDIPFDPARQQPNQLPDIDNINHYDTFVLRQEVERAVARKPYGPDDFWRLGSTHKARWSPVCCDPYRRMIFASDMDALTDLSAKLTHCIADGLETADVAILTLGLTGCWRNRRNGLYVCDAPSKQADDERHQLQDLHLSTFAENYENVVAILDTLKAARADLHVVLTVSPVALHRTWALDEDVVIANMTSKSTLRAVVGQICRERPDVIYWPSYEFAAGEDIFAEDGRHVRPDCVERILSAFLDAHALGGGTSS